VGWVLEIIFVEAYIFWRPDLVDHLALPQGRAWQRA